MKFTVQMKDPDSLYDAIQEAVGNDIASLGLDTEEQEALEELRRPKVADLCARWFQHGEYLMLEIDTEAETCTVKEG